MANDYKYNPITNMLDIVSDGGGGVPSGNGGKFVGVTGIRTGNEKLWLRIAQFQFTCSNIQSEPLKKNLCFDAIMDLTKQNTNPYSFDYNEQSARLSIHIQIPYITDTYTYPLDPGPHYTQCEMALLDNVNFTVHDFRMVEAAHVVADGEAYVYCDLYVKANTVFDRFFYTYVSNEKADVYGRIAVVPVIAEDAVNVPYGTGINWKPKLFSNSYYTQEFTSVDTVSVQHYLNKFPSVTILDSANRQILGDVQYIDENSLTVTFTEAITGKIICN